MTGQLPASGEPSSTDQPYGPPLLESDRQLGRPRESGHVIGSPKSLRQLEGPRYESGASESLTPSHPSKLVESPPGFVVPTARRLCLSSPRSEDSRSEKEVRVPCAEGTVLSSERLGAVSTITTIEPVPIGPPRIAAAARSPHSFLATPAPFDSPNVDLSIHLLLITLPSRSSRLCSRSSIIRA